MEEIIQPIALTWTSKNRIDEIRHNGVKQVNFTPDAIDIFSKFTIFNENNIVINDDLRGFKRLIEQPGFVLRQVNGLKKKLKECQGLYCRHLVRFPDIFSDFNNLRNVFRKIHKDAGLSKTFVFVGRLENYEIVDNYIDTLHEDFVLVLDIGMKFSQFSKLLNKYISICKEVVLLYRNWDENKETTRLAINLANANPEKMHMAFVPVDINSFGDGEIFSNVLICNGFKSVSIVDSEFKAYIKRKKTSKPKTISEKLSFSKWINEHFMEYETAHNPSCNCFGKQDAISMCKKCGIAKAITHHNFEVLSNAYLTAKSNPEERKKLLELESVRALINSLKL